jgi:hypothetical protein
MFGNTLLISIPWNVDAGYSVAKSNNHVPDNNKMINAKNKKIIDEFYVLICSVPGPHPTSSTVAPS